MFQSKTTAEGHIERLPALVADLVQRKVDLIFGNSDVALAAKAATSTIPIVFVTSVDTVANGLVASFNQPGGNVTGVRLRAGDETTATLIDLGYELLPAANTIGLLINPQSLDAGPSTVAVQSGAKSLGFKVVVAEASVESDQDRISKAMASLRLDVRCPDHLSPFLKLNFNLRGELLWCARNRLEAKRH